MATFTTQVANCTGKTLWVLCSSSITYTKTSWIGNDTRFEMVNPCHVIPFETHVPYGDSVYISIYYNEELLQSLRSEKIWIAENYPRTVGHNVIVASDFTIRPTKAGTLWTDESDFNHEPKFIQNEDIWFNLFRNSSMHSNDQFM